MTPATPSRSRWWCTVVLLLALTLSLVQPALAAGPGTSLEAVTLLHKYNIVRGDSTGDLKLGAPITRAEMAVILVRINGRENDVANLKNLGLFPDTNGHWAEGYVASARIHSLMKGFDDGNFYPNEPVTYGQALTLVLRLVGREPSPASWPVSALIDAAEIKAVPPQLTDAAMLSQPALRGEIFASVAWALIGVKTSEGLTYFQKYVDSTPPELNVAATATSGDSSFRLEGTAKGATRVLVNGEQATLTGETFSRTVSLSVGQNRFTVEAFDLAENRIAREVEITRSSPAARVTIVGPDRVKIGGSASYVIQAFDTNDSEVSAAGATARVTGSVGTFDVATGTFRASHTSGTGKIEVTLGDAKASVDVRVLGPAASATTLAIRPVTNVAYTQAMTVAVEVRDSSGTLVSDDYGRSVSLSASGLAGVTITPQQATTEGGVAQFTVRSTQMGSVAFTATNQALASGTQTAKFMTTTRVVLVADPARVATSSSQLTRIRAELRDDKGALVPNKSGQDIYVDLTINGPGSLLNSRVRIAQQASTSAQTNNDGIYSPGSTGGTATITGTMSTAHNYSVDNATVSSYLPTVGAGTKLQVLPLNTRVNVGEAASFVVQLVDADNNPITTADYGFQVAVSTSNNEPKIAGKPEGMEVTIGDNPGLNPVSDGQTAGSDVIARTVYGSTVIKVVYDKPGTVTLSPIAVGATETAYATDGTVDKAAASSSGWISTTSGASATFQATANTIKLTVDSDTFGKEQPAAANRTGTSRTLTLHAYVAFRDTAALDNPRHWVPGTTALLGLYKNGGATRIATATASDGKATFTVTASSQEGEDTYVVQDEATSNPLEDSNPIYVRTDSSAPAGVGQPIIRGVPSNTLSGVLADDTGMEIELPLEPAQHFAIVRVYPEGSGTPIYTSAAIDVSTGAPKIRVPKSAMAAGVKSYQVAYRNGYGEGPKSVPSDPVTNYTFTSAVGISSARYDAVNKKLYLFGSGFAQADTLDPGRLRITDPSISGDAGTAYLSLADVLHQSGYYVLTLASIPGTELAKLDGFAGSAVKISGEAGWYTKANGQMANEDLNNIITPLARLDYAVYDKSNRRVLIYGRGFSTGTLARANVSIGANKLSDSGMSVSATSDGILTVYLNTAAKTELDTSEAVTISALDGWFTDTSSSTTRGQMAAVSNIPVYAKVRLDSVAYSNGTITISGDGFVGRIAGGAVVKVRDNSLNQELPLTPGTVSQDGRTVTFTITGGDKSTFETSFKGGDVYLIADQGWFEVEVTETSWRPVSDIPNLTLKFNK